MISTPAALRGAIVACCLGAVGCGGSSHRAPEPVPPAAVTIQTEAGVLRVVAEGCEPDLERMAAEVDGVYRRAVKANPSLQGASLAGWSLHARTPEATRARCQGSHGEACTDAGARTMHVWCPTAEHRAGGTEHEASHALAYAAGLRCWRTVLHQHDFRCRRVAR